MPYRIFLFSTLLTALAACTPPSLPTPPTKTLTSPSNPLNDTGITTCVDYASSAIGGSGQSNENIDCAAVGATKTNDGVETDNGYDLVLAGQDAVHGRDAAMQAGKLIKTGTGEHGFDFTKLDENGQALPDQSQDFTTQPYACVRDNVTGLVWEVKTNTLSSPAKLRDENWRYTWYNSSNINDGGDHGIADTGVGTDSFYESGEKALGSNDNCFNESRCDTEKYIADVNATKLCGFDDWRLPSSGELFNLIQFDDSKIKISRIIENYPLNSIYWTSSASAEDSRQAWAFDFYQNSESTYLKNNAFRIRLVRGATP